ncbi:hypothetical protein DM02DRAFT_685126 [Periconia macrospinosa]|uniref:BZIP domain-containing protein n=1 Tax=Periconia macrospinosa TaxID=97972 RepID=A0A2V1DH80_9PLEO|nr:hypothetical protein DM02DRAFT_685126 [Periconia macrospinosa]
MENEQVPPVTKTGRQNATAGRSTLNPSRLERKRATDRESQRANRARTKAYITHLEKTTKALEEAANGGGVTLSNQLKAQYHEIEHLKSVINSIAKLANGVNEHYPVSFGTESNNHVPEELGHRTQPQIIQLESSPTAGLELGCRHSPDLFDPSPYPGHDPTLNVNCGDQNRNYSKALNHALLMVERCDRRYRFTSLEVDNDTNIRAVLHGWDAARSKNPFDIGWQLLQTLDEGLFFRSGSVERIAILRIIRSMLLVPIESHLRLTMLNRKQQKVHPHLPPERRPPSYMNPTTLQATVEHPRLVDYFVWPSVRDYLIMSSTNYATEKTAAQFAVDIGLRWPFDLRDVCKYEVSKGKYTFSKEFNEAYSNLDTWYFKSPLTSKLFPALNPIIPTAGDSEQPEDQPQPWHSRLEAFNQDNIWNDQIRNESNFTLDIPALGQLSAPHSNGMFFVQGVDNPGLCPGESFGLSECGVTEAPWSNLGPEEDLS